MSSGFNSGISDPRIIAADRAEARLLRLIFTIRITGPRNRPVADVAGATAPNAADAQGAYETEMSLWGAVLGNANLVYHAAGWQEGGLTASYEKLGGGQDATQCATALWKRALQEYEQPPLEPAIHEALNDYVQRRRAAIGVRVTLTGMLATIALRVGELQHGLRQRRPAGRAATRFRHDPATGTAVQRTGQTSCGYTAAAR
jgi:hypothetical protein